MKNKSKIISLILCAAVLLTCSVISFAENGAGCEHEYRVTAFESGVAELQCKKCRETCTEAFADHINERDYAPLDVVEDGIVNGKDYAYLMHKFSDFGSANGFDGNEEPSTGSWDMPGIEF